MENNTKIKYETELDIFGGDISKTPCPHYEHIKVGSYVCRECKFFIEKGSNEKEIVCGYSLKK